MFDRCGRRSGSAGEIRHSVRTRSARRAATCSATAPPIELPNRCTGCPGNSASIVAATAPACAGIE